MMQMKKKIQEEKGSMAAYVAIILLGFLIILVASYIALSSVRNSQLTTILKIKESYEQGNDKIDQTYQEIVNHHIYFEDFKSWNSSYSRTGTQSPICENGILTLTSTNSTPRINMNNVTSFNPKEYQYVDIKYKTSSPAGTMKFIVEDQVLVEKEPTETPTNEIEEPEYKTVYYTVSGNLTCDGNWHILRLDLSTNSDIWNKSPLTSWIWEWASTSGATVDIDYIRIHK